jgi:hypothetical protein
MDVMELEQIVRSVRGLSPDEEIQPNENWDSLDHLALISVIAERIPPEMRGLDLSELTNFTALSEALCG